VRDREVVASIVAGDPSGLAAAYDSYAPQLLAYCRSLLREPADAADAVQDTFVIAASRVKDLRDPDRLRPWLYTVARNSCLRKLKAEKAAAAIYPAAPGVAGSDTEVGVRAELADLRALVRDASAGLTTRDREVLVLRLWQGMDASEAASVLGVSRSYGNALFARARDQLEVCLGVLLVARSGEKDCPRLATLLENWDGKLNVLLRKRLSRHIDRCTTCSQRRRFELVPALLGLSAGAAIAGAAAADAARQAAHMPVALKGQVLAAATGHSAPAAAAGAAHAAGTASGAAAAGAAHAAGSAGATAAGASGATAAGAAGAGAAEAGAASAAADAHPAEGPGAEPPAPDAPPAVHTDPAAAEALASDSGAATLGKEGLADAADTGTRRVSRSQLTAAAGGVAAAAVIATAIAFALSGGSPPANLASGASGGLPGIPGGSTQGDATPGDISTGAAGLPSAGGQTDSGLSPGKSGSTGSGLPSVGVLGGGKPQPTSGAAGVPSGTGASTAPGNPGSGASSASVPPSSAPPSSAPPSTSAAAPGTLGLSTKSIPLDIGGTSTLTLTANGGPVNWSISMPETLLGDLSVSQSSGTLPAGHSVTLTVKVVGLASIDSTLEVKPGDIPVTVAIGLL
jgi:RNA polymerase sigma factor (sigma-70 family)